MQASANSTAKRVRDPRLDFFRGIAMLIIFVAHVPANYWGRFIPARFGPSDATEMFVFCSGFAAAIAFGGTFVRAGFWMGTARVVYRIFTLYIAHIMMFLSIAIAVYIATQISTEKDYVTGLALNPFFNDPGPQLIGLFTLTYVPNYFDIMPMYIGVLAMMPIVILAQRIHTALAITLVVGLYMLQWNFQWDFPSAPFNENYVWFFNPLGWQLLFFTGFALSRGWIKAPPVNTWLVLLAIAIVIFGYLTWNRATWRAFPEVKVLYDFVKEPAVIFGIDFGLLGKTDFGLVRYAHFLALAYLAVVILKGREQILYAAIFKPIRKVGQQALVTFVVSMFLSRIAGMALDYFGREPLVFAAVNLTGMAILVGVAYFVGWYKLHPWRKAEHQPRPGTTSEAAAASGRKVSPGGARPMPAE